MHDMCLFYLHVDIGKSTQEGLVYFYAIRCV